MQGLEEPFAAGPARRVELLNRLTAVRTVRAMPETPAHRARRGRPTRAASARRATSGPAPRAGAGRKVLIAAGLALGPVVAIGLARFAYSLLLPAMRADLGWSFAQAGAMNTANALGYLVGAIGAGPLLARAGHRRPYLGGLALTALALLASAATTSFGALIVLRLVAGAAGAVVFIAGAGFVARLVVDLSAARSAALVGGYTAGGGLGVVISAGVLPPVVGLEASGAWRWGWLILGAASLLALAASSPAALDAPEPPSEPGRGLLGWPARALSPTLVAYGLFGAGYIAYVTFIVAFLKTEGFSSTTVSLFWAVLGGAAVAAAFAWGPVLGRLRGGHGPAAVLATTTLGAFLPLAFQGAPSGFASALLFGGGFLAVPAAVINLARCSLSPARVASAIAALTVCFGIGQSVGPVLAGVLSDGPAGVRIGLYLAVAILAAATMVAVAQRPTRSQVGDSG